MILEASPMILCVDAHVMSRTVVRDTNTFGINSHQREQNQVAISQKLIQVNPVGYD